MVDVQSSHPLIHNVHLSILVLGTTVYVAGMAGS